MSLMAFAITIMEMFSGKNNVFGMTTQSCNKICHLNIFVVLPLKL